MMIELIIDNVSVAKGARVRYNEQEKGKCRCVHNVIKSVLQIIQRLLLRHLAIYVHANMNNATDI